MKTPSSIISTDLNGDGTPDLVVASAATGEITVYLGIGQGRFANPATYNAGGHPVSIASADLSGSGRQDIIAANGADRTVSVLRGAGDGTLGPSHTYSTGVDADLIAVGSLRGDGKQDVAIASVSGRKLAVLLNDGHGSLSISSSQALARTPVSITISHFSNGSLADLALANDDGTVSVLLGRGDGKFEPLALLNIASSKLSFVLSGDFNRDGKVDLAVAQPDGRLLTVLLGNGDGSFTRGASYSLGNNPVSGASIDVNGDGIPDLVAVNNGSNTFSTLLGNGDGSFKTAVDSTVGDGPIALASGDFYGKGATGLAVLNAAAKTVSVVDGKGDGSFKAAPAYSGDLSPRSIVSGDLNGDGRPDLIVANFCGTDTACGKTGTLSVYLAKPSGGYGLATTYSVGAGPVSVLLADLNGDKKLDTIVLNRTSNTISIFTGIGDGTFEEPRTLSLAEAPVAFAIGDFNNDNKVDLAIATDCGSAKCSQPGSLQILFGKGDGSFSAGRTYTLGYSPTSIAIGDLRQTGSLDILVANRCGGDSGCGSAGTATVLTGDGKGNFTAGADLALGSGPSSITLGSLHGGKVLDLIVSRETDNAVAVLRGHGDGSFASPVAYSVGNAPRSVIVGSFAGTGTTDVAVSNYKDSTVSVLFGNGDGTLKSAINYAVGAGPQSLTAVAAAPGAPASIVTANSSSDATPGHDITDLSRAVPEVGYTTSLNVTSSFPSSSPAPVYGTTIVFTATVTATNYPGMAGSGTSDPNGKVTLTDESNNVVCVVNTLTGTGGTTPASTGTCSTATYTPLTGVTHTLTANFQSVQDAVYQDSHYNLLASHYAGPDDRNSSCHTWHAQLPPDNLADSHSRWLIGDDGCCSHRHNYLHRVNLGNGTGRHQLLLRHAYVLGLGHQRGHLHHRDATCWRSSGKLQIHRHLHCPRH